MCRRLLNRLLPGLAAALFSLALFAGCSTLDAQQRRWIFQPASNTWWASAQDADGMDDVWIEFASDVTERRSTLHGLWLPHAAKGPGGKPAPLLLYLHGARWDVMGSATRVRRMHDLGFSVLAIDYRGFGKSSAELPSETMAYEDAAVAWRWLAEQHPGVPRYVFGHSLGSAIAVHLAADVDDEAGVILESAFTSVPDVVAGLPWGWLPLGPLISQRFDARARIDRIGSPLLSVHGSADQFIPATLGRSLYERAVGRKRWMLVEGGTHFSTNALGETGYKAALQELFGIGSGG